jgi:hypothetical protein
MQVADTMHPMISIVIQKATGAIFPTFSIINSIKVPNRVFHTTAIFRLNNPPIMLKIAATIRVPVIAVVQMFRI